MELVAVDGKSGEGIGKAHLLSERESNIGGTVHYRNRIRGRIHWHAFHRDLTGFANLDDVHLGHIPRQIASPSAVLVVGVLVL